MTEETNQAETKRTLWRMGVVGHPDYRQPTSPKASSDPEKKTLFPVKIRCTRNFTLRKKSPNSNLPSSSGIQLQSFSKLHLTSQSGSPTKGQTTSTAEDLSSKGSLTLSEREVHKYQLLCREAKKEHVLVRPRSCAADIDVSLSMKRREFAGSSSWKERVVDNNDEDGPNDLDNNSEREREASLDLIRESLCAAFGPDQRQMSDDKVFEDEQEEGNEDDVIQSNIYQTSFDSTTSYFTPENITQTGNSITNAVVTTTDAGSTQSKPLVKRRIGGILGSRTTSAVYDSLPSSPLFNPGETWRYKDASTQCQEEETSPIAPGTSMIDKKTEQRRRKYGRAFRQKRAATIGGNSEPTTVERRRKPLTFSRSQSECCSTEGRDQFPHTFSFRNFREKKRNTLHFPDYLIASMTLLPDCVNFMGDNKSLPDQSPHNGYLSDDNSEHVPENNLLPLCGADSEDDSFDVLPSPRVSPDMTHIPNVVVISDSETTQGCSQNTGSTTSRQKNFLSVPKKHLRRVSSGSLTSGSDESEGEPSPPLSRRGRRSAIYDAKNFGDVSPSTLSPELSPSNSCDEGEGGSNLAGRLRRRRSSVDIPMSVYPGDLLGHGVTAHNKKLTKRNTVADFATRQDLPTIYSEAVADSKKGRQTFSLLKLMKTRSKENLTQLEEVLMKLKPSEFRDNTLIGYKNLHWSDLIASPDTKADPLILSCKEMKRREAVWELFKSEVIFLVDHLMVLKHCFMEPLKKVQVEGHLMFAEPRYLFGNLDEICYVSYTFCKDFLSALLKSMSSTEFGTTTVLIKAFQRFSCHSKDGDVYHIYCLNYMNAMSYLEQLRRHEEFCEFEKWCEQDQRCNRLQVPDLLVAPIQHCTKLPLMLSNIRTYTEDEEEKQQITESIEKVENSLYELEDKMKWLKNYERVREIHQQLIWPTINEIDPRVFIPDFMKHMLQKQPCEKLLTCPKRQLLHEGQLSLIETTKTLDAYVFLFDDIVIITKYKKSQRKHQRQSTGEISQRQNLASTLDRGTFTVYRQPIALDRLIMHDLTTSEAISCGLKNTFVLLHISRFQQVIGVYTLQTNSESAKNQWVTTMKEAKEKYAEKHGTYQDNHSDRTTGYPAHRGTYATLNTTKPPADGIDNPVPQDLNGSS